MKITDLMIGNWVAYRRDFPDKVDGISTGGHSVHLEHDGWVNIGDIQPVPLTPEILEKNEFDLEGNGASFPCYEDTHLVYMIEWGYHEGTPTLHIASYHPNVKNYGSFLKHGVNNVHELQNAIRLCGIEKEVVL